MPVRPMSDEYEWRRVVVLNEIQWRGLVMVLKGRREKNANLYTKYSLEYGLRLRLCLWELCSLGLMGEPRLALF